MGLNKEYTKTNSTSEKGHGHKGKEGQGVRSQRTLMKKSISQRERCWSPLDVETIDQLLILEVLCSRAQWIMRRQFRQGKSITV